MEAKDILNELEEELEEREDFIVSLRHFWQSLAAMGVEIKFDDLEKMVRADKRFHVHEPNDRHALLHGWSDHFAGPIVMLESKKLTIDDVYSEIHRNLDKLAGQISDAYMSMPQSSEGGDQLLNMLHNVESLKYDTLELLDKTKKRQIYRTNK